MEVTYMGYFAQFCDYVDLNRFVWGFKSDLNKIESRLNSWLYIGAFDIPSEAPLTSFVNPEYSRNFLDIYHKIQNYNKNYGTNAEYIALEKKCYGLKHQVIVHNKNLEALRNEIKDFSYELILQKPDNSAADKIGIFEPIYIKANKYSEATSDIIDFREKYSDLKNNLGVIQEQYKLIPVLNNFINNIKLHTDIYYNKRITKRIIDDFQRLLPSINWKKEYYPFPNEDSIRNAIAEHNDTYISQKIDDPIFNDINGKRLDNEQRKAVLCEEDTNIVIASAGSGKTLTICGRVKYLLERMNVLPEDILLLSYSKASVKDLEEKIKPISDKIEVRTFHSLGLDIIAPKGTKNRPIIETQFLTIIKKYFDKEIIKSENIGLFLEYFGLYFYSVPSEKTYKNVGELYTAAQQNDYKTLKSNLITISDTPNNYTTLKEEHVKSYEELVIANYLYLKGIRYEYERPYEHETATPNKRQYCPDFYLTDYHIYLEHYGINKQGKAVQFDEENAKEYEESIIWKRELHKQHNTICLETYSYLFSEGSIFCFLEKKLKENGVAFHPLPQKELEQQVNYIIGEGNNSKKYYSFQKLVESFISLYKSQYKDEKGFDSLSPKDPTSSYDDQRAKLFLDICKKLFVYYKSELVYYTHENPNGTSKIDFDDMILRAIDKLDKVDSFKFKHIIVDEFQDISISRMRLLKKLIQHGEAKLFAVGDDWQSIYRFAGSDLDIFVHAEKYFDNVKMNKISTTYRNSAELIDVVEPFITANENQIKKELNSNLHTDNPIRIVYHKKDKKAEMLVRLLASEKTAIYKKAPNATVYLIGRNTNDLSSVFENKEELVVKGEVISIKTRKDENDKLIIKGKETLNIEFITAHKAKGLEADYVVIINAEDTLLGFPNKIDDDPLLNLVLSAEDNYPLAEERRLFYVALTRTKNITYILADNEKPSKFVLEIENSCNVVNPNAKNQDSNILCPWCKSGMLIKKRGKSPNANPFYGCSNYPYCKYKTTQYNITNKSERMCSVCGDFLVKKDRRYGPYLECANRNCGHTEDVVLKRNCPNYYDDLPF